MLALLQELVLPSIAIAKESTEHCTILTSGGDINGNIGLGGLKIYLSNKAIKVLVLNGGGYLMACAPSWRVVQFNPNNNLGMTWSLREWMGHTPRYTYFVPDKDDHFIWQQTRTEPIKVFGKDCIKARMHRHSKEGNWGEHEYIFLPHQPVSQVACSILQKLVNAPTIEGIPVSFRTLPAPPKAGEHQLFITSKIEEIDMPETFFAYPTGFKLAKHESDIVSDSTRNRLIEETFGY